jgi:hypothetical protein
MANFPSSVYPLNTRTDLIDTVVANDVNTLQAEINALETTLGVGGSGSSLLYSNWSSGTFTQSGTVWASLNARIGNIELGLTSTINTLTTLQTTLVGSGNSVSTLLSSTWTGTFSQGSSWTSLQARLINMERGVATNASDLTAYKTLIGNGPFQLLDADLTAIAALNGTVGNLRTNGSGTWSVDSTSYLSVSAAAATYQPKDNDLTAIGALTGTYGFLKKTATDTWTLDTASYQPLDADLTAIAGLSGTQGQLTTDGAGTWYVEASISPLLLVGM